MVQGTQRLQEIEMQFFIRPKDHRPQLSHHERSVIVSPTGNGYVKVNDIPRLQDAIEALQSPVDEDVKHHVVK